MYGDAERDALARAWLAAAPFDLRVNPLKTTRDEALAALAASGIDAQPTPYSPLGLRVAGRPSLARHPWLVDGALEVQDEGSQLVALPRRAEARRHGRRLLRGRRRQDVAARRADALAGTALRVRHASTGGSRTSSRGSRARGCRTCTRKCIAHERDTKVKRLAGKIDRVLVDAPCTGFGTLRRNPDLKWRQPESALAELAAKQQSILAAAATLVKPGGRLVYATCSVLPEENEAIVDAFLAAQSGVRARRRRGRARARRHRARHRARAQAPAAQARLRRLLRRGADAQGVATRVAARPRSSARGEFR